MSSAPGINFICGPVQKVKGFLLRKNDGIKNRSFQTDDQKICLNTFCFLQRADRKRLKLGVVMPEMNKKKIELRAGY
jgi:hypothetical protein